jgi:pimeloyl-ACP methyl ester carboxylesterase
MQLKSITLLILVIALSFGVYGQGTKPSEKWATFDGNKIGYYDIGNTKSQRALVFVHCWTCNVEFWKDSYTRLNYRVIAMDLPGHGTSDKPKVDY